MCLLKNGLISLPKHQWDFFFQSLLIMNDCVLNLFQLKICLKITTNVK